MIPWEKPWTGIRGGAYNRVSRKPYSLLNQMLLKHDGEYATFRQWKDLGGHIRRGEKSEIMVFWKVLPVEDEKEDGTKEVRQIPILKHFNVFHVSQVEGVEALKGDSLEENFPIDESEKIIRGYWEREGIKIEHAAGDSAYYSPSLDMICLPLFGQFISANEYYSTAFHESIHSTMKESRCNRAEESKGKLVAFGSGDYSKEELVAEIGSAALMNIMGIETQRSFRNNVAYIQNWLSVLKNDVTFIVSASGKAEKAVRYILGEQ